MTHIPAFWLYDGIPCFTREHNMRQPDFGLGGVRGCSGGGAGYMSPTPADLYLRQLEEAEDRSMEFGKKKSNYLRCVTLTAFTMGWTMFVRIVCVCV